LRRRVVPHAARPQIIIPASLAITRQLAFWPREFNKVGRAPPTSAPELNGLTPAHIRPTSALGLGSSRRHHAGTGLTPPTSALGLGSPRPHLRWDWAHPAHICAWDWAHPAHICAGTGLAPPASAPLLWGRLVQFPVEEAHLSKI
jgi:hypothetical protein